MIFPMDDKLQSGLSSAGGVAKADHDWKDNAEGLLEARSL